MTDYTESGITEVVQSVGNDGIILVLSAIQRSGGGMSVNVT